MSRPIWAARRRKNEVHIKNGAFENVPVYTAAQTRAGYWISGTADGDIRDNRFGWYQSGAGGQTKYDTSTAHTGGSCLYLFNTNTGIDLTVINYQTAVEKFCPELKPNTVYTFSIWIKTNYIGGSTILGNGVAVQALLRKKSASLWATTLNRPNPSASWATGNLTVPTGGYLTTATNWTRHTGQFTTPDDLLGERIFFAPKIAIFNTSGTAKDLLMQAWFDDLQLFEEA